MELIGLLLRSYEPTTDSYPESDESNLHSLKYTDRKNTFNSRTVRIHYQYRIQPVQCTRNEGLKTWRKPNNRQETSNNQSGTFSIGLNFDPENGGNIFLRNDGKRLSDYMASHPRRQ
jgi:hypothetical protein